MKDARMTTLVCTTLALVMNREVGFEYNRVDLCRLDKWLHRWSSLYRPPNKRRPSLPMDTKGDIHDPFLYTFPRNEMMEVADKSYLCYIQYYSKWVRARKQDDLFIHDIHFFPFSRPSLIRPSLELKHAARWPFRDHGLACWPSCTVIGGTVNRKMGWMSRRKLFLSKMWPLKGVMVICHDERGFTPC